MKVYAAKIKSYYWAFTEEDEEAVEKVDISYDPFPGLNREEASHKLGMKYLPENLWETDLHFVAGHFDENSNFVEDELIW